MKLFIKVVAVALVTAAFSSINMAMDLDDPNKLGMVKPMAKIVANDNHEDESDDEHEDHKSEETHSDHEGHGEHPNGAHHDENCRIIHARKPLASATTSEEALRNHIVFCLPCDDPDGLAKLLAVMSVTSASSVMAHSNTGNVVIAAEGE